MAEDMPGQSPEADAMEDQGENSDPMALVSEIGQKMAALAQIINQIPDVPDSVRARASKIMDEFSALADEVTQGMGGGEVPADQGAMPMMGGAKGIPGGPQSKM